MKKIVSYLLLGFSLTFCMPSFAILSLELTRGVSAAIPIAVFPFNHQDEKLPQDIAAIISNDLQMSGQFKINSRKEASDAGARINYFKRLGVDYVVVGRVSALSERRFQVSFSLEEAALGNKKNASNRLLTQQYIVNEKALRPLAHHISDLIYEKIIGVRGVFATKLVYVLVERIPSLRYTLEVADQDGYAPKPLLQSREPIMSPAWSPNGKQIAYVSFERHKAAVYLQEVASGRRSLLSEFPGINGAPAWSPDGRKLALVLSKGGTPNIYLMDIRSHQLKQLTHDFYINTEPAFSPDGRFILYTSNRSGSPQIYQLNLATQAVSRVTYDGNYNARASFTHDGHHIAMIHRVSGVFNIAILDLETGKLRILNKSLGDSSSPSIAPNGSMVLYDTIVSGRNVLGMASTDGRIQLMLPARQGEAQDPSWSPYLG